MFEKIHKN